MIKRLVSQDLELAAVPLQKGFVVDYAEGRLRVEPFFLGVLYLQVETKTLTFLEVLEIYFRQEAGGKRDETVARGNTDHDLRIRRKRIGVTGEFIKRIFESGEKQRLLLLSKQTSLVYKLLDRVYVALGQTYLQSTPPSQASRPPFVCQTSNLAAPADSQPQPGLLFCQTS